MKNNQPKIALCILLLCSLCSPVVIDRLYFFLVKDEEDTEAFVALGSPYGEVFDATKSVGCITPVSKFMEKTGDKKLTKLYSDVRTITKIDGGYDTRAYKEFSKDLVNHDFMNEAPLSKSVLGIYSKNICGRTYTNTQKTELSFDTKYQTFRLLI